MRAMAHPQHWAYREMEDGDFGLESACNPVADCGPVVENHYGRRSILSQSYGSHTLATAHRHGSDITFASSSVNLVFIGLRVPLCAALPTSFT